MKIPRWLCALLFGHRPERYGRVQRGMADRLAFICTRCDRTVVPSEVQVPLT